MPGRLIALLGIMMAFMLTAQLRGSNLTDPSPRTIWAIAALVLGVIVLAGVVGGNWLSKRRKPQGVPSQDEPNRRQTYRILYPENQRPRLRLGNAGADADGFEVIDLSEEGVCFTSDREDWQPETVAGELLFQDGRRAQVAGTVVRTIGTQVCVRLTSTVPPNLVVEEQLRLRKQQRAAEAQGNSEENA